MGGVKINLLQSGKVYVSYDNNNPTQWTTVYTAQNDGEIIRIATRYSGSGWGLIASLDNSDLNKVTLIDMGGSTGSYADCYAQILKPESDDAKKLLSYHADNQGGNLIFLLSKGDTVYLRSKYSNYNFYHDYVVYGLE